MKDIAFFRKITFAHAAKAVCMTLLAILTGQVVLPAQDQFYIIQGDHNDKVLALTTNSTNDGTLVQLADRTDLKTSDDNQQFWYYDPATQNIRLSTNSDKCLSRKNQQYEGDPIHLWYCSNDNPRERWVLENGMIKLAADKNMCLSLNEFNFNAGNAAVLKECTNDGTYQKWYFQKKAQVLTANGKTHQIDSPGETYVDMTIPDPCPYPYLMISAKGGDGGYRSVHNIITGNEDVKSKGGQGATVSAVFKIGTGAFAIKPGTNLRLVIGRAGQSLRNNGLSVGSGGGGGTGVLYEYRGTRPAGFSYYPWKMLMVAGGGGGAYADAGLIHHEGQPGSDGENGTGKEAGTNGWASNSTSSGWEESFGRGWKADNDPARSSQEGKNGSGGGFRSVDGYIQPIGGKITSSYSSGGYGFGGGGGSDEDAACAGGGGGNSGGGISRYLGGGGGGSNIDWPMAVQGTTVRYRNTTSTSNPANGHVKYLFFDGLMASRPIRSNDHLSSSNNTGLLLKNGPFELYWQGDGNLVLRDKQITSGSTGIWSCGAKGSGSTLVFQYDGNLVIYNSGAKWATSTADNQHNNKGGQQLVLTSDGNLEVQDMDGKVIWQTNTGKRL